LPFLGCRLRAERVTRLPSTYAVIDMPTSAVTGFACKDGTPYPKRTA
jgi:hypothetical protein